MMNARLEKAQKLKKSLVDFLYDAEGDLAVAFESYVAQNSSRERYDLKEQNLVVDCFLTEGTVGNQTPIDLFLASEPNLSESDRNLIQSWQRTFTGLFEVVQVFPEGCELMNWLTAKHYLVLPSLELPQADIERWQPGEIILSRIAPLDPQNWMFSGACIAKGKLGKPKLAVAIGEFKENYKQYLYGDAPELLEEAWDSVVKYHEEFVEFFGSDRLTLSGYQLNKKIGELQEKFTQKRFAEAGLEGSESLKDILQKSGADAEEIQAAALEAGVDSEEVVKALNSSEKISMVVPKAELPPEIKKADEVAVFSHPRWGQMFLTLYPKLVKILETSDLQTSTQTETIFRKALADPQMNYFVWEQLKAQYPSALESALKQVLNRPEFSLEPGLKPLLVEEYQKPLEPELPEIASVPLHLHKLFEEAIAQVHKTRTAKTKPKPGKGFR